MYIKIFPLCVYKYLINYVITKLGNKVKKKSKSLHAFINFIKETNLIF